MPRGLVWGQLTLIVLVVLTWFFACGALDSQEWLQGWAVDGEELNDISYPLAEVDPARSRSGAFAGAVVVGFRVHRSFRHDRQLSRHDLRQRAGRRLRWAGPVILPGFLGMVHAHRRTPMAVITGVQPDHARLRHRQLLVRQGHRHCRARLDADGPGLVYPGHGLSVRAAAARAAPVSALIARRFTGCCRSTVILLSVFAVYVYSGIDVKVIPLTALLYALGLAYYWFWGHARIQHAAPEELAARQAAPACQEVTR